MLDSICFEIKVNSRFRGQGSGAWGQNTAGRLQRAAGSTGTNHWVQRNDPPSSPETEADGGQAGGPGETAIGGQKSEDRIIQSSFPRRRESRLSWIPAFAGMTVVLVILLNSGF